MRDRWGGNMASGTFTLFIIPDIKEQAEHSFKSLICSKPLHDTAMDLKECTKAVPGASNSQGALPRVLERKKT